VVRDLAVGSERRRQHQANLVLRQEVAGAIARAGLRAAICLQLKAKRALIEVGGLLGVADVEFDVIGSVDRKRVVGFRSDGQRLRRHQ